MEPRDLLNPWEFGYKKNRITRTAPTVTCWTDHPTWNIPDSLLCSLPFSWLRAESQMFNIELQKYLNRLPCNGWVNISTSMTPVGQHLIVTLPFVMSSITKKYWISVSACQWRHVHSSPTVLHCGCTDILLSLSLHLPELQGSIVSIVLEALYHSQLLAHFL